MSLMVAAGAFLNWVSGITSTAPGVCWMSFRACSVVGIVRLPVPCVAPAVVVARAGLGTLNHTALTMEALHRRGISAGVVIGAWPADPELVHWANLTELVPDMVGALPDGAGRMDPGVFRRSAPGWLTPALYGVLDNWRVWAEETGEGHH